MKKKIKRLISAFIVFVMSLTSGIQTYGASSDLLYEKVDSRILTAGVTYKEINRLYKAGWMDIYVLEIDAQNNNVGFKVLESASQLGGKHTVLDYATTYGVKAAVNADFFGSGSPMSSMGQVLRNGKMEAAQNYYNGSENRYAGFFINNDGIPFIDYVKSTMGFYNSSDATIEMGAKNKFTDFSKPVYFDRSTITSTAGIDSNRDDLAKIVVNADGIISDISGAGETVEVPENGYIIAMNKSTAAAKMGNYSVGQKVGFNENNTFVFRPEKSVSTVSLGVSGGGELLRNGEIVANGLIIGQNGRNPRTMVGVNKDKTKAYIVCIDGRGESIGATHSEAAEVMADLGCYDAIHFDGGGSTTMAVEDEDNKLYIANEPSEGSQRRVANALGVASIGESTGLTSLEVSLNNEDNIMFNGFGTAVYVKGLDNNMNPAQITHNIDYSANIKGVWQGNTFIPEEEGECVITVTAGNASGRLNVKVLGGAAGLALSAEDGSVDVGGSTQLKAQVINRDGYAISANNNDVKWSVDNENIAYVQNGRLYGKSNGDAVVTAECNGATAKMNINIGTQYASVMSFEGKRKITSSVSAEGVTGSAQQFDGIAVDGKRSVGIKYGFQGEMTTTQSVFAEFANGIPLPANTKELSFWYKTDSAKSNGCLLKAVVVDANDKSYGLVIDSNAYGTDWKKANVAVPKEAVFPVQLKKLCVETLNTTDSVSGTVYVDNVGAVIGGGSAGSTQTDFVDPMRNNMSIGGGDSVNIYSSTWQDTYETREDGNVSIINLASSTGSLTSNGSEQLRFLRSYIEKMSKNTIVINMNRNLLSSTGIKSSKELSAIMDILKTGSLKYNKNIIVVCANSAETGVNVKDGIRYVNLSGNGCLNVKADGSTFGYTLSEN